MSWCEPKWRSTRLATSTSAARPRLVEAGLLAPLRGDLHANRSAPGRVGHVLDLLRAHRPADDLARDLADEVVVRASSRRRRPRCPSPQLALTATMLGSPLTGLQVNITPETSASTICWTVTPIAGSDCPSSRAVADRPRRVEADPAVADGVAELLDPAHPEEALLLAGEGRVVAVLAERARADRDRRLPESRRSSRELAADGRPGSGAKRIASSIVFEAAFAASTSPRARGASTRSSRRARSPRRTRGTRPRRARTRSGRGSRPRAARRGSRSCRRTRRRPIAAARRAGGCTVTSRGS